ncbi:hypothetical protein FJ250_05125 [bacterium]|nr:hypothetical protein [bacterium]
MLAATGIPDRATRYGSYQRTKVELDAQIAEVERMMRLRLAGGAVTDGTVAVTRPAGRHDLRVAGRCADQHCRGARSRGRSGSSSKPPRASRAAT